MQDKLVKDYEVVGAMWVCKLNRQKRYQMPKEDQYVGAKLHHSPLLAIPSIPGTRGHNYCKASFASFILPDQSPLCMDFIS